MYFLLSLFWEAKIKRLSEVFRLILFCGAKRWLCSGAVGREMVWFLILAAVIVAVVGYLIYVNRNIRLVRLKLKYHHLPIEFDGYRILLMSDLHDKRFGRGNLRLLYYIQEAEPDMIVMAGDMHDIRSFSHSFADLAEELGRKGVPLFFAEGNHDIKPKHRLEYEMFMKMLAANGVTVLHHGKTYEVQRYGKTIPVCGVGWFDEGRDNVSFEENEFCIFVKHDPLGFDRMTSRPSLMLSGHVHGGLIELPGFGAVFSPGNNSSLVTRLNKKYFRPKYYKGVYHRGGCDLVVSRGLGNSGIPFRFLMPEMTVITLLSGRK